MARPYSEKFIEGLTESTENSIGVNLARACVLAKLPVSHVAIFLGVSRITLHRWFRGGITRRAYWPKMLYLQDAIKEGCLDSRLPAKDLGDAWAFLQELKARTSAEVI
jgi:hypothetical protein